MSGKKAYKKSINRIMQALYLLIYLCVIAALIVGTLKGLESAISGSYEWCMILLVLMCSLNLMRNILIKEN